MNKEYKIFCFKHPTTQQIKYIGRTTTKAENLYSCYKCQSNKSDCKRPVCMWIKELGKKPIIKVLEITTDKSRKDYYINKYSKTRDLLNVDKKESQIYVEAGKNNGSIRKHDPKNLIELLIKFYKQTKRFPLLKMGLYNWSGDSEFKLCQDLKIPSALTYIRLFGSYKEVRNIAYKKIQKRNVTYDKVEYTRRKAKYSKEQMVEFFVSYKLKTGEYPKVHKGKSTWKDPNFGGSSLSVKNYYKMFGNLTNVKGLADKLIPPFSTLNPINHAASD